MKKIIVIILCFVTILNIIAGSIIFLDVRSLEIPETTLTIDMLNLNATEAVIKTTVLFNNTNSFSLTLQDLTVTTTTDDGFVINQVAIDGGEIEPQNTTRFTTIAPVRFNGSLNSALHSRCQGTVGVVFLGVIQKTLPFKFTLITPVDALVNQFEFPRIQLSANFTEITPEGVNLTGTVTITNPNSFDIEISDLLVNIHTNTNTLVGSFMLQGATIHANTIQQLTGSGNILLKALDAHQLRMTLDADTTVIVAGIRKPLNLQVTADITPPRLEQLLSDLPTDASLTGEYSFILRGLRDRVTLTLVNPNKLSFLAKDITVSISRVDRNKTRLIGNGTIDGGVIDAQKTTILTGDMIIPYVKLLTPLGGRILPDQLQVIVRVNITIPGINQTIWVGMVAYQNFRIF